MPEAVVLSFNTYQEPETFHRRVEVKAIDVETALPVVSLSLGEMAAWLRSQGFHWLKGSSGVWERAAHA
jgi:Holliday junction resolvasome RuvABC DNA-binding subunit